MSIPTQIKKHINQLPLGTPFLASSLRHLATTGNIRKILSRMVMSGELKRLSRGLFVKPKQVLFVGESIPSPQEVAHVITKATGEKIAIHGAEAARRFHLSTQTPMQPIFYTSGNSRRIKLGRQTIVLKHICARKITTFESKTGEAINALWYLGKENVSFKTINTIRKRLSENEFNTLLNEVRHMPAWMANLFFTYQQQKPYG